MVGAFVHVMGVVNAGRGPTYLVMVLYWYCTGSAVVISRHRITEGSRILINLHLL